MQQDLGQFDLGHDDVHVLKPTVAVDHHAMDVVLDHWSTDPAAVFASQPAQWLEAFLVLAAARGRAAPSPPRRIWFQLHAPAELEAGCIIVRFDWWPRDAEDLFGRFTGQFVLTQSAEKTVVRLEGHTSGGTSMRNERVLRRLIALLGIALSTDQTAVG